LVQCLCSARQQRAENCLFPRVCLYSRYCPPQGEKEDERGTEALYCLTSGPLYIGRMCRYCPPQGEKEGERGMEALYCLSSMGRVCRYPGNAIQINWKENVMFVPAFDPFSRKTFVQFTL